MFPIVFLAEITIAAVCLVEAVINWRSRQHRNKRLVVAGLFLVTAAAHVELGLDGLLNSAETTDLRAQLGVARTNLENLCDRLEERDALILGLEREVEHLQGAGHPQVGPRQRALQSISPDRMMNKEEVMVFRKPRVC